MTEYKVEVFDNGDEEWRNKDGWMHREGGPAFTSVRGHKAYWKNGKRHREDGPAVTYEDGAERYYIEGKELTKEEFEARNKPKHEGQVVTVDGVEYKLNAVTK